MKQGLGRVSTGEKGWVGVFLFLLTLTHPSSPLITPTFSSVQQEVYVTATVESFGEYQFSEGITFQISEMGKQEVGQIIVEGLYNGAYPWILRVYTDNLHFAGVGGAVRQPSPAGLVSEDGRFVIPLSIHSPSFGPDVFRRIPDLSEPGYLPYQPDPDPGDLSYSDCILMGIDPRNATWVAGTDQVLFTEDDNPTGDNTLPTPFALSLYADVSESAVRGSYDTTLYFEIIPAP